MELLDLAPFTAFIKSRNLVPEKYISYYVAWVRRYLQVFCEQLERDSRIQDWQIDHLRGQTINYKFAFDGAVDA